VHDVFHISQLRKCLRVSEEQMPFEELTIGKDLTYQEYPVKILDTSEKVTRNNRYKMCKVQWSNHMSHPGSRKQNRSLHSCAQNIQITCTANNMVNRYNISLNYKLESLQNDIWVQKKYYRVTRKSKHRCVFHRHHRRRGRPSLYLLAPAGTLGWTLAFCST
jgi:hypothetical protein